MSKKLVSKKFNNHLAQQFIESITEPANNVYYMVASKHTQYTGGDDTIPQPYDTVEETELNLYNEMIFGKKVTSSDVSRMIPRYDYDETGNTVYDKYDHRDTDLFSKQFYVTHTDGSNYFVYKVLDNNNGAPSTQKPTDTDETACNFITTADNYVWKYMYKMSVSDFEKFATDNYMPVVTSANTAAAANSGAIDVVVVANVGSNYIATLNGTLNTTDIRDAISGGNTTTYKLGSNASSNTGHYVGSGLYFPGTGEIRKIVTYTGSTKVAVVNSAFTSAPGAGDNYYVRPVIEISGDGSGAVGYAEVDSTNNHITRIKMVTRGSNYTYATAVANGFTGGIAYSANLIPIIPPVNGHGTDAESELGASLLGISVDFTNSEGGFVSVENDFRKIGLIKDPQFKNVVFTLGDDQGTFVTGETIHQINYKTLSGSVTTSTSSTTVTGTDTDFVAHLSLNDKVLLQDPINKVQSLRTVSGITNTTSITVNTAPSFSVTGGTISYATVLCSGVKTGNVSPYLTASNVEPKFAIGKRIIGASSGAFANITAIAVNEKSYNNWSTFDNRLRMSYSANTNLMSEDALVYQVSSAITNAYFHSANSTYIFLTNEKGTLSTDSGVGSITDGSASFTPGGVRYEPDIRKGSGQLIYIENTDPISRSGSQSETIKIVMNF